MKAARTGVRASILHSPSAGKSRNGWSTLSEIVHRTLPNEHREGAGGEPEMADGWRHLSTSFPTIMVSTPF